MRSIKDIYSSNILYEALNKSLEHRILDSSGESIKKNGSFESYSIDENEGYRIQNGIRDLFGKPGVKTAAIGGHPDFNYLEEERIQKNGYVVSFFMDIQGSTRLGLIYKPEEVFFIKNTIIKCAIETINAFDGHVHRIMGDAVLAFFRANDNSARNAAIDAINCGTYLVEFMRQIVKPELQNNNLNEDVGIRVGIDYGKESDVLWGMYGYRGSSEVTATSFYVDVAAKLQQSAPRNRVMIGNSLKDFLDLHDDVIELKTITVDNIKKPEPFIYPNYRDIEGKPINYRKFVITHKRYFDLLPKPEWEDLPIRISSTLKSSPGIQSENTYNACSRSISKPYGIDFKANFRLDYSVKDVKVKFRVSNNGTDALKIGGPSLGNHETIVDAKQRPDGSYFASRWECTRYTGLHYMYISVWADSTIRIKEQCYGVYVGSPQ